MVRGRTVIRMRSHIVVRALIIIPCLLQCFPDVGAVARLRCHLPPILLGIFHGHCRHARKFFGQRTECNRWAELATFVVSYGRGRRLKRLYRHRVKSLLGRRQRTCHEKQREEKEHTYAYRNRHQHPCVSMR